MEATRTDPGSLEEALPGGIAHPRAIAFRWTVEDSSLSDAVAHVNNVTYVRWVDRVAELAGEVLGRH